MFVDREMMDIAIDVMDVDADLFVNYQARAVHAWWRQSQDCV